MSIKHARSRIEKTLLILFVVLAGCGLFRDPTFDCPEKIGTATYNENKELEDGKSYHCYADDYRFSYVSGIRRYHCNCKLKRDFCFNYPEWYHNAGIRKSKDEGLVHCTIDLESKYVVSQDDCEGEFLDQNYLGRICKEIEYKKQ